MARIRVMVGMEVTFGRRLPQALHAPGGARHGHAVLAGEDRSVPPVTHTHTHTHNQAAQWRATIRARLMGLIHICFRQQKMPMLLNCRHRFTQECSAHNHPGLAPIPRPARARAPRSWRTQTRNAFCWRIRMVDIDSLEMVHRLRLESC